MILWIEFLLCAAVIFYSGSRLSKYGDIIAKKTGLGGTWIGVVLLATVTSLPELFTGISSVTYADAPDIAVGNVLGACVTNMLTLALLDLFNKSMPISGKAQHGHTLSAGFCILLLSITALGIFLKDSSISIGWIGHYTLLFIFIYFIAIRLIFLQERKKISSGNIVEKVYHDISLRRAFIIYGFNGILVIAAAVFLPEIGKGIAESTGLGQTFVGNVFLAISTTLPELVVSISAVKMGSVDLAVGNLMGSNIFNILILGIDDIFLTQGPLLSFVKITHIIPALSAIAMLSIAIIGLTYRAEKKNMLLSWDSALIIMIYIINIMLLYTFK